MLDTGDQAPSFELPDLDGKQYRLEEGLALAIFWKPACGTCDLAFPYLQRLIEAYDAERWQMLAISQEGKETSGEFARRYGLTMPVLIDGEGWPVSQQYDPEATPTFYLIGPDGKIEMTSIGFSKEDLNEVSRRVAVHLDAPPKVIAEEDDGNPIFRPG